MRISTLVLAPALMLAVACGRDDKQAAADSSLNRDLSLANQVSPYPQDTLGAAEGNNLTGAGGTAAPRSTVRSSGTRTASRTSSSTTRRRTSSSSSSGGTVTTSSGGNVSTSSGTVTQKNTKRDAAIGAAAGAIIGATTSKDKVKGGVIGAVVGGVLGGVIGNNVDVKKKKPPQE
jgi:hypothetical protein